MNRRTFVDERLDSIRFLVDRQRLDYQPLPWLGIDDAPRSIGVRTRWERMAEVIEEVGAETAVDIGCNAGYFVLSLAERGLATVGIESDPRYARLLLHARKRLPYEDVTVSVMKLTPTSAGLVPRSDATLFLAVWHHLVREFGLDPALGVLRSLWEGTRSVMFFETGQSEMPPSFGLPEMEPDPNTYITALLEERCPGGSVRFLGEHDAFDADRHPCRRGLFAVVREPTLDTGAMPVA
jgi:hypothetical protein